MKCLYCGGPLPLALLKKITGAGEFCSEQCRSGYQSEFNRLAVGRLQQARVTRRVLPVGSTELNLPSANEEQAAPSLAQTASFQPISSVRKPALEEGPPQIWSQSALTPPAPVAVAEREEVPEPSFLAVPAEPQLPVWVGRTEAPLDVVAPGEEADVEVLLAALQTAVDVAVDESPVETASLVAPPPSSAEAREESEDEAGWMSPRGMISLSLQIQPGPQSLRMPPLVPAPIFVYLQLPESLISSSVGKTGLWWAGQAEADAPVALGTEAALYGNPLPLVAGLRQARRDEGQRRVPLALKPSAGFKGECADLRFAPGASPLPAILPNLFFAAPKPTWSDAVRVEPAVSDERFDPFLREEDRDQTRERLQKIMSQKAAQRARMAEGPTVTLPVEAVQPALNLLASVSSSLLARQRQGEAPGSALLGLEEALPRIAASLVEAPVERAEAPLPLALPSSGPVSSALVPQAVPVMPAQEPAAPQQSALSAWAPVPTPDGRPSGWPEDVPYPPASAASPAALASSPESGSGAGPSGAGGTGGGAQLPGMPPIQGNVYMFGNEINAKDDDDSKALVKADGEVPEETPKETEAEQPNFTRPGGGFPLSGGGTMNVGTMVVVNQPSGTVNINASSPTAATFESRLSKKGPAPLSNIAEPVGVQMPVPLSPKELPLRMNFQGRLDAAMPVRWPELDPAVVRRKMFLGAPMKPRKDGEGPPQPMRPAASPSPATRPMARPMSAPEPAAAPADTGEDKSGAMGWIKSFSNRFGKK